jgi:hypothetical protein
MAAADDDRFGPPPLTLGEARLFKDRADRPWSWRLAVLLRALAAVELVKGLVFWTMLITAGGTAEPLSNKTTGWLVSTIFLAVADPVAAVGLWLGAPWGVAIWLIAAVAQFAAVWAGGPKALGLAVIVVMLAAMAAYVVLSAKARAELR